MPSDRKTSIDPSGGSGDVRIQMRFVSALAAAAAVPPTARAGGGDGASVHAATSDASAATIEAHPTLAAVRTRPPAPCRRNERRHCGKRGQRDEVSGARDGITRGNVVGRGSAPARRSRRDLGAREQRESPEAGRYRRAHAERGASAAASRNARRNSSQSPLPAAPQAPPRARRAELRAIACG